jgi:hypothetical protein
MLTLAQFRFGAHHRRQMPQPQHAGACLGAQVPHLGRMATGLDGVAVAARRARAGFIGHLAQDNCFAIFADLDSAKSR